MGFSTTNRNIRLSQPRQAQSMARPSAPPIIKRPIAQQISRPIPRPQMSRPMQSGIRLRPPTGLPQQPVAPTGLPNVMQPPAGLPNTMQQPTGLPPTQMQMPTPPVAQPVEQSSSLFAPPPQQPTIDPVFQQPQQPQQPVAPQQTQQTQQPPNQFANEPGRDSNGGLIPGYGEPPPGTFLSQPVDKPGDIYGGLTPGQALGGEFTMQQPDKNQYVSIDGGRPANPMSQIPMMGKGQYDAMQQPVAGPIDPSFAKVGFGRFQDEYGNWIT